MNREIPGKEEEIEELLQGLSASQKYISPKFFYDERGSYLFEKICELPEYYLTRTELGIMSEHIGAMADAIGPQVSVIEFGSGAGVKIRLLLDNLSDPVSYIPVDISMNHLQETAQSLAADYPEIEILPVAADFTRPFPLPRPSRSSNRNLVYFPGSTIGNFAPEMALELLRVMRIEAGSEGGLLIGIDLKKEPYIIENAYNDKANITAEFNLNVLRHLNREYQSNFDLDNFKHKAIYNKTAGRIEMSLVSLQNQGFSLHGHQFELDEGEEILTEYCHKFDPSEFEKLANTAGFEPHKSWSDRQDRFSIQLYKSATEPLVGN